LRSAPHLHVEGRSVRQIIEWSRTPDSSQQLAAFAVHDLAKQAPTAEVVG